jgi:RNA polymerase sigma-70 factor (ECF subfamily)
MNTAVASTREADEFADWVRPALLPMTRLARRLAPDHDPQDVVQDALTRAWRKRHLFDPDRGAATTWLLAITADRAREARRSRTRRLGVVDDTGEAPDVPAPAPDVDADLDLDRAIGALPERQHLAVELHYFLGLTVAETASVMDCSAGTVKSTLFDARTHLRTALGEAP